MAACTLCSPPRAQTMLKKISKTSKLFSPSYYLGLVFHTAHSLKYWVKSFKRCNVVLSCAKTEFCRSTNYSLATALPEQIAFSIFTPSDFLLFELPVLCSAIMEQQFCCLGLWDRWLHFRYRISASPESFSFRLLWLFLYWVITTIQKLSWNLQQQICQQHTKAISNEIPYLGLQALSLTEYLPENEHFKEIGLAVIMTRHLQNK